MLSPKILNYIDDDTTIWEREPLESLAKDNELSAYVHDGFWYPMDTLRDKLYLEECWSKDRAFWKKW